jgi:hypothetical protein
LFKLKIFFEKFQKKNDPKELETGGKETRNQTSEKASIF